LKEQLKAESKGEQGALDQRDGSHVVSMDQSNGSHVVVMEEG